MIGGNMQVLGNVEIEFPIFDKVGIRGVVFADMGNAFNLEDQYCKIKPSNVDASKDPVVHEFVDEDRIRFEKDREYVEP